MKMTFYLVKEMPFLMPFPVIWFAKGVFYTFLFAKGVVSNEIIEKKNILQRHLKILTKEIEIQVGL